MIVISDTTPLITLMKAGRLDVLNRLFGDVLIPEAVYEELTCNDAFRDEVEIIQDSSYIKVVTVGDDSRVSFLQRVSGLDLGESEAIIYADEVKADLLLMDEIAGRRVARNMSLTITGSIGILVQAFQSGILSQSEVEDALRRIRESNRHISEKLISKALKIIHDEK